MRLLTAMIPVFVGFAIGFCISTALLHGERLNALETRVTQLETARKAQALINLARVQLRENP